MVVVLSDSNIRGYVTARSAMVLPPLDEPPMVVVVDAGVGLGAGKSMRVIRDWRRGDTTRPNDGDDDDDDDDGCDGLGGGTNSATSGSEKHGVRMERCELWKRLEC